MSIRPPTAASPIQSIRHIAGDIKIAHSVFALPFALLAAFMAATGPTGLHTSGQFGFSLLLVVCAMVSARSAAMIANRLLDRKIDGANPRTAGRALPSGRLSLGHATVAFLICCALFLLVCLGFLWLQDNAWPIMLGIPVLLWICLYPLAKRFTFLCHAWLGISLAMSPLAAALAIAPDALLQQPAIWLLAGMVLAWVTGFDVLYALQDVQVDRSQGLHSMPSTLGPTTAIWISRLLHATAIVLLALVYVMDTRLHMIFLLSIAAAAAMLLWEHVLIARFGTDRITLAFFTLNGVVSCIIGTMGIIDLLQ
jgi:4-hydroxybenzoate polyprenyltransferase